MGSDKGLVVPVVRDADLMSLAEIELAIADFGRRARSGELTLDVFHQDVAVNPAFPWLMNVWTHAFETHFSNSVPEDFSCADNRGSPSNDLFILNHFLTDVFGSPALAEQVNYNPLLQGRIGECETFHGAIANFVTVDFVSIGDTLATIDALN